MARAERSRGKGVCHIIHLLPPLPPQVPKCSGARGTSGRKGEGDSATPGPGPQNSLQKATQVRGI